MTAAGATVVRSALDGAPLGVPAFRWPGPLSVTSLSRTVPGPTEAFLDERFGHLQTAPLGDAAAYYDTEYRIVDASDEDDVLHDVVGGKCVFRQTRQEEAFRAKVPLRAGMRVLDYGCGKGTVMKRLLASEPGLEGFLYDVSRTYEPLWLRFLPPECFASYRVRAEWHRSFDVVTSFFSLEHAVDPLAELRTVRSLLRPGGTAFVIVPDAVANPADLLVVDHAHHYSEPSLRGILALAGLRALDVDRRCHPGAFVALATPSEDASAGMPDAAAVAQANAAFRSLASYWERAVPAIRELERAAVPGPLAIYGAGVYGTFVATVLADPSRIACFVDRNPLLHGAPHLGRPVVAPAALPPEVRTVIAGLNPASARAALADVVEWRGRALDRLFLPDPALS